MKSDSIISIQIESRNHTHKNSHTHNQTDKLTVKLTRLDNTHHKTHSRQVKNFKNKQRGTIDNENLIAQTYSRT